MAFRSPNVPSVRVELPAPSTYALGSGAGGGYNAPSYSGGPSFDMSGASGEMGASFRQVMEILQRQREMKSQEGLARGGIALQREGLEAQKPMWAAQTKQYEALAKAHEATTEQTKYELHRKKVDDGIKLQMSKLNAMLLVDRIKQERSSFDMLQLKDLAGVIRLNAEYEMNWAANKRRTSAYARWATATLAAEGKENAQQLNTDANKANILKITDPAAKKSYETAKSQGKLLSKKFQKAYLAAGDPTAPDFRSKMIAAVPSADEKLALPGDKLVTYLNDPQAVDALATGREKTEKYGLATPDLVVTSSVYEEGAKDMLVLGFDASELKAAGITDQKALAEAQANNLALRDALVAERTSGELAARSELARSGVRLPEKPEDRLSMALANTDPKLAPWAKIVTEHAGLLKLTPDDMLVAPTRKSGVFGMVETGEDAAVNAAWQLITERATQVRSVWMADRTQIGQHPLAQNASVAAYQRETIESPQYQAMVDRVQKADTTIDRATATAMMYPITDTILNTRPDDPMLSVIVQANPGAAAAVFAFIDDHQRSLFGEGGAAIQDEPDPIKKDKMGRELMNNMYVQSVQEHLANYPERMQAAASVLQGDELPPPPGVREAFVRSKITGNPPPPEVMEYGAKLLFHMPVVGSQLREDEKMMSPALEVDRVVSGVAKSKVDAIAVAMRLDPQGNMGVYKEDDSGTAGRDYLQTGMDSAPDEYKGYYGAGLSYLESVDRMLKPHIDQVKNQPPPQPATQPTAQPGVQGGAPGAALSAPGAPPPTSQPAKPSAPTSQPSIGQLPGAGQQEKLLSTSLFGD